MKTRIVLIIITFSFLLIFCGCSITEIIDDTLSETTEQLSVSEKVEDFEYMYIILKENYPFFEVNKRLNKVDWLNSKDDYIEMVRTSKNDKEFFDVMDSILQKLNNGHTHMIDIQTYKLFRSILMDSSMEPWVNQINNPKVLKRYLGKEESSSDKLENLEQYILPNNVTTEMIAEGKIAYISIKSFNYYNITEDMKKIRPFLHEVKDFPALIIDIRQNSGGSMNYWYDHLVPMLINEPLESTVYHVFRGGDYSEVFIKNKLGFGYDGLELIDDTYREKLVNSPPELKDTFKYYFEDRECINPKNSIRFNGKIYLLVDRRVYSASEAFAVYAKSTGFATLVGEKTGGDGIGFDPFLCTLPNSGYIFRFSSSMGLTYDGTCNEEFKTVPDIEVDAKEDISSRYDSAIKKIIELENTK